MSYYKVNKMIKISVIIPVYNAENFIQIPINSLLNQSFTAFEAIFINDGSKDNSTSKIQKLVNGDGRFRIIEQENAGPGAARNRGIMESNGEYISFLDSDDYFDKSFLRKMYDKAQQHNADIVVCDFNKVSLDGQLIKKYKHLYSSPISNLEGFVDIMESNNLTSVSPNKLFKKYLFQNVKYPRGISVNEDVATIYRLILKANKIAFVNEALFYYVQIEGSSMHGFNPQKLKDRLIVAKKIENHLISENYFPKYKSSYNKYYLLNVILSGSLQICKYSLTWEKDLNHFLNEIDKNIFSFTNIFSLHKNHKQKMIALFILKINKVVYRRLIKSLNV